MHLSDIIDGLVAELDAKTKTFISNLALLDDLQLQVKTDEAEITRLKTALQALTGTPSNAQKEEVTTDARPSSKAAPIVLGPQSEPLGRQPPIIPNPQVISPTVPSGPLCKACGSRGTFYLTSREMDNGKNVTLRVCNECNSEQIAA